MMRHFRFPLIFFAALPLMAQTEPAAAPPSPLPVPLPRPPAPHCDSYSMQTLPTLNLEQKTCYWASQLVTGNAILGSAIWGAAAEWQHSPKEWPQGFKGFGEQVGTRYTQGMVKSTATFLAGAIFREDPRYETPIEIRCSTHSSRVLPRLGEALIRTVWMKEPDCARGRLAVSRIIGSFASGFTALAWQPPSTNHLSTALTGTGTAFAGYLGDSVVSEFQGDVFRLLGKVFTSGKSKAP